MAPVQVQGLTEEAEKMLMDLYLKVAALETDADIEAMLEKGMTAIYLDITLNDGAVTEGKTVLEIPVAFDAADKLDIAVYRSHQAGIQKLTALSQRPADGFVDGTYYLDAVSGVIYIYTSKFSAYGICYHTHDLAHVPAKAPTPEADGNIEYWYCEGCGKYY